MLVVTNQDSVDKLRTDNIKEMSNRFRVMALLAMVLMWVSVAPKLYAKVEQRPIYICGYAVNFADSTVYLTEIQRIDTAYVESKNGFLMDRNQYSSQLQFFMKKYSGGKNYTCMILFDKKQARLQKRVAKVSSRDEKDPNVRLVVIDSKEFQFIGEQYVDTTPVILDEEQADEEASAASDTEKSKAKGAKESGRGPRKRKGESR